MMAADLARALDPALWFRDAEIEPDEWQVNAIRSKSKRQLWNVHRQGGKSTTAGLKAIEKAVQRPDCPTLLISPSQRQSAELLRSCLALHSKLPGIPEIIAESAHRMEMANGGRIISLPSSEATVRGYSKVALLVLDEASRIPDELISACRPMLAVSDGEILALSTPSGKRGFFFESWQNGGDTWERTRVTVDSCARISKEFLAEERATLGEAMFRQEYLCEFCDNDEQLFSTELIDACFTEKVRPLWQ